MSSARCWVAEVLIYPPTEHVLIIPVHKDGRGIFSLYLSSTQSPGILFKSRPRVVLSDQVQSQLRTHLGHCHAQEMDFWTKARIRDLEVTAVMVMITGMSSTALTERFCNFPQALRQMVENRDRLIFLKAWQFLAGSNDTRIKVTTTERLE